MQLVIGTFSAHAAHLLNTGQCRHIWRAYSRPARLLGPGKNTLVE